MAKSTAKAAPTQEPSWTGHLVRTMPDGGVEYTEAVIPPEALDLFTIKRRDPGQLPGLVAQKVAHWFRRKAMGYES